MFLFEEADNFGSRREYFHSTGHQDRCDLS